jgi:cysteine desulfurase
MARIARTVHPKVVFHTDAIQAAPFFNLEPIFADVDMMSLSAHKFGGPKGIGVLVKKTLVPLAPLIIGGGQERELRSGTQNVAGAVGLATALMKTNELMGIKDTVVRLRNQLADKVQETVPNVYESAPRDVLSPGHLHLRFDGVTQEEMLVVLDQFGICASGGAACASGALKPNHVLAAMGVARDDARTSIRFSLGYMTSDSDIDRSVTCIAKAVEQLRSP